MKREIYMGKILRELVDGGYYHIIQRGNNKLAVFHIDQDYQTYLGMLKHYFEKFNSTVKYYCLMPNHIHLLVQVGLARFFPKLMQAIALSYAYYYKRRYGYTGALWQGRYKSYPITTDEYLIQCTRYIQENPVRAQIVQYASDYLYSGEPGF